MLEHERPGRQVVTDTASYLMIIHVKNLKDRKTFDINCTPTQTADDIKAEVEKQAGVPPSAQRLVFDAVRVVENLVCVAFGHKGVHRERRAERVRRVERGVDVASHLAHERVGVVGGPNHLLAVRLVLCDLRKGLPRRRARAEAEDGAVLEDEALQLSIEGHTDTVGPEENNRPLSTNRANTAFRVMTEAAPALRNRANFRGQPVLGLAGYGEMRLAVPTADNVNEPANRRIDIRILMQTPATWPASHRQLLYCGSVRWLPKELSIANDHRSYD